MDRSGRTRKAAEYEQRLSVNCHSLLYPLDNSHKCQLDIGTSVALFQIGFKRSWLFGKKIYAKKTLVW